MVFLQGGKEATDEQREGLQGQRALQGVLASGFVDSHDGIQRAVEVFAGIRALGAAQGAVVYLPGDGETLYLTGQQRQAGGVQLYIPLPRRLPPALSLLAVAP